MSETKNKSTSVFDRALDLPYSEPAAATDWDAFMTVVKSRRSVRVFEPEPIPEDHVRQCLRAALLAPNSSNLQQWEFYWVRSAEKKAALVHACLSQPAAKTAAEIIVCVARTDTWRRNSRLMLEELDRQKNAPKAARDYYSKLVPIAYGLIGPCNILSPFKKLLMFGMGLVKPTPREPTTRNDLRIWAIKSAALACENLMLAFRARGYDSCPMEGLDSRRVRKLLDLPASADVVMAISAGKRSAKGVYGPQIRFDEKYFLFEV